MFGTGIDLELAIHGPSERTLGKHPFNGPFDHPFGAFFDEIREGDRFDPPRIAGVGIVNLIGWLVPCDPHLAGVDNDDIVARVHVGGVVGLVFSAKTGGDLAGQAAKDPILGVDEVPSPFDG